MRKQSTATNESSEYSGGILNHLNPKHILSAQIGGNLFLEPRFLLAKQIYQISCAR